MLAATRLIDNSPRIHSHRPHHQPTQQNQSPRQAPKLLNLLDIVKPYHKTTYSILPLALILLYFLQRTVSTIKSQDTA